MSLGSVSEIWRYPVMGLQGERLGQARITLSGVEGDHVCVLRDKLSGRILDPKSLEYAWGETKALPSMIELSAELRQGAETEPKMIIGMPNGDSSSTEEGDLDQTISRALGHEVELIRYPRVIEARVRSGRTLHFLTDASLEAISALYPGGDFDVRRFRPNITVSMSGRKGFVEEEWVSRSIRVGEGVLLRVEKPNVRCKVTTLKQRGLDYDPGILATIEKHNATHLGVMCSVLHEGTVHTGDQLTMS